MDDSNRGADLGGGDGSTVAEPGLPIAKGLSKVVGNDPDCCRPRLGDGLAAGPEDRVAKESNAVNGHRDNLRLLARFFKSKGFLRLAASSLRSI
jgi:hypothetical protein